MLTFPHIGNIYIFIKVLLDMLKVDYVTPPPCSKRTYELGIKYAPEMACLPLKINLGNFLESIELGADTVIITAGCGPCRFSYYGEMHKEMLKSLGHDNVKVVTIDSSDGIRELMRRFKLIFNSANPLKIFYAMLRAYYIIKRVDDIDRIAYKTRAREIKIGSTNKIMDSMRRRIDKVKGRKAVKGILDDIEKELKSIELDKGKEPIKVGLVGDIYTLIEPSSNIYIEKMLGNMGVEVHKSLYISKWIEEHIIKGLVDRKEKKKFDKACKPYMDIPIGGHARESIGNSALYAENGFDGVIQIYPLTCMPEIVASSVLPTVSGDKDIPILTLVLDEISGEAGYKTRIDAFIDVLKKRRELKAAANECVLYRN